MSNRTRDNYHHGDLRSAVLVAAAAELAENGVEGFTMRGCARRAGVSHAAPAYHFGDLTGLFTALATDAFRGLSRAIEVEVSKTDPGSIDRLVATTRGYANYAFAQPDLFKLMFRTERLDVAVPELREAGQAAIHHAEQAVGAFRGVADPMADDALAAQVYGLWAFAHGFVMLTLSGQFGAISDANGLADMLLRPVIQQMFSKEDAHGSK